MWNISQYLLLSKSYIYTIYPNDEYVFEIKLSANVNIFFIYFDIFYLLTVHLRKKMFEQFAHYKLFSQLSDDNNLHTFVAENKQKLWEIYTYNIYKEI